MSRRMRFYVATFIGVLIYGVYARTVGQGLTDVAYYGVAALMLVVICPAVLVWSEMAHDGDLRRRPHA